MGKFKKIRKKNITANNFIAHIIMLTYRKVKQDWVLSNYTMCGWHRQISIFDFIQEYKGINKKSTLSTDISHKNSILRFHG